MTFSFQPILTAQAQVTNEAVYPDGSSFGLVPFDGATESTSFSGFIDVKNSNSVMINEMPLVAWAGVYEAFNKKSNLQKQGIKAKSIKDVTVSGMVALQVSGTQTFQGRPIPKCIFLVKGKNKVAMFSAQMPQAKKKADACALITGITERGSVSLGDKLASLPFGLSDLGGMRPVVVQAGSAAVFTIGPEDQSKSAEQPVLIIAPSIRPVATGQNKQKLAEQTLRTLADHDIKKIKGVRDLTIDGYPSVEVIALAEHTDAPGVSINIVQWMVFKPDGNYVRLIGAATTDKWDDSMQRFKAIRDGLDVRLN